MKLVQRMARVEAEGSRPVEDLVLREVVLEPWEFIPGTEPVLPPPEEALEPAAPE